MIQAFHGYCQAFYHFYCRLFYQVFWTHILAYHRRNQEEIMVYLDTERKTPKGWVRVYTAHQAIDLMMACHVSHLDLSHDLGSGKYCGNGYQVVHHIKRWASCGRMEPIPRIILVHSVDGRALQKMILGLKKIRQYVEEDDLIRHVGG